MKVGSVIQQSAIRHIFSNETPGWILQQVVRKVNVLPPPTSSAVKDLRHSIERYIERNIGKQESHFCTYAARFILESNTQSDLNSAFKEPAKEAQLKPVLRRELKEIWSIHPKEVAIPPSTRADIVGYKRHFDNVKLDIGLFERLRGEPGEKRVPWYEFLGVELKTAKRSKDPMYRQAAVYTDYFDYSFSVITPLTVLKHGYASMNRFEQEMRSKGMGILLANQHGVLGTILKAEPREISRNRRQHLVRELEL